MIRLLVIILLLSAVGAAAIVAGVYLLAGVGWALIVAGLFLIASATLLRTGLRIA